MNRLDWFFWTLGLMLCVIYSCMGFLWVGEYALEKILQMLVIYKEFILYLYNRTEIKKYIKRRYKVEKDYLQSCKIEEPADGE